MSKKVALQTDPTSDGSIVVVPSIQATLNGLPIATQGSQLIYKGNPGDRPAEFVSGVLLNNKPLTFVGAKTAAGATILTANQTTATIESSDGANEADNPQEPKEVSKKVELKSKYPMLQIHQLATEVAKSTFYFFISVFFDNDIPIIAYENLYNKLMDDKDSMMPEIVVLKTGLTGGKKAAFNKEKRIIEVRETTVVKAVEGSKAEKQTARSELLRALLEEYGHFLDHVLRNEFSKTYGDTLKDEGAVFSYYYTNYKIEDSKIDYAIAIIDGNETRLVIDLAAVQQNFYEQKERMEADYQTKEEEFFAAGKGNMKMQQYGHFDFEKDMADKVGLSAKQLSWLYLGNYMRDMSQLITPTLTDFGRAAHAKMDALDEDMRALKGGFFAAIKPGREAWTKVVEILAAHHTIKEYRGEAAEALDNKAEDILNKGGEVTSLGKAFQDWIKDKAKKMGLKTTEMALDYLLFQRHFEGFGPEDLGVYRPEEHIDNPIYAAVYDDLTGDIYYCPPNKDTTNNPQTKPSIGDVYGMKRFIKNEEDGTEIDYDKVEGAKGTGKYADGNLPTAVKFMNDKFAEGVAKFKTGKNEHARYKGLTDIGAALHVLEDYFAHTNFCEVLLIKHGVAVYPWVDMGDTELTQYGAEKKIFQLKSLLEEKTAKPATAPISDSPWKRQSIWKMMGLPEMEPLKPDPTWFDKSYDDILEMDRMLKVQGIVHYLPSFRIHKGFYFTFTPRGRGKQLYLAEESTELPEVVITGVKITGRKANTPKPKVTNVAAKESVATEDPLYLQCTDDRKEQLYNYRSLTVKLVKDMDTLLRDRGLENNNYPSQIPIVSGYFGFADTAHSIVHVFEKLFEAKEINLKTMAMSEKDDTYWKLIDMIIYTILADMVLSQEEENKATKDTGISKSKILEWYKYLIEVRGIVINVIEHLKKNPLWMAAGVMLVESIINATYRAAMNLVYAIIREMLEVIAKTIKTWQDMQLVRAIGTNPSHSQLAKDHVEHPLHSLAGKLALHAVLEVGKEIRDMIRSEGEFDETLVSRRIISIGKSFMVHPCHSDWADQIARDWISQNPDRIEQQHKEQYAFEKATYAGQQIATIIAAIEKELNGWITFFKEKMEQLREKMEQLKAAMDKFFNAINKLKQKSKRFIKKLMNQMADLYDELMTTYQRRQENPNMETAFDTRISFLLQEIDRKKHEIMEQVERSETDIVGSIGEQAVAYNKMINDRGFEELQNKGSFEQKLFDYCYKDTADGDYQQQGKQMQQYYVMLTEKLKVEKTYLAYTPRQHQLAAMQRNEDKQTDMA